MSTAAALLATDSYRTTRFKYFAQKEDVPAHVFPEYQALIKSPPISLWPPRALHTVRFKWEENCSWRPCYQKRKGSESLDNVIVLLIRGPFSWAAQQDGNSDNTDGANAWPNINSVLERQTCAQLQRDCGLLSNDVNHHTQLPDFMLRHLLTDLFKLFLV